MTVALYFTTIGTDLDIDGRKILKYWIDFKEIECELDSSGSGYGSLAGS
jgi:hypothetical protein